MTNAGDNRVLRGGSWNNNNDNNLRASNRNNNNPDNNNNNNGFRCANDFPVRGARDAAASRSAASAAREITPVVPGLAIAVGPKRRCGRVSGRATEGDPSAVFMTG